MDFLIQINYLPQIGCFFLFYYVLFHTSIPGYIKRGALIYHRHTDNRIHRIFYGEDLHEDIYALEDKNEEEVKEEVKEEAKEEAKELIKFEDKYLSAFKLFSKDYFFTEDELLLKAEKYTEFKEENEANRSKIYDNVHNLLIETQIILNISSTINEEVKALLVKYFEIEEEYNDDPLNIDFYELYIYVENDSQKFLLELEALEKDVWSTELEAEIQGKALNYVLDKKLDGFVNNYILEYTPLGNVYMRYNNQKKSFEYYSNNSIPYRFLETIGRKYVMTFRCKSLFVDLEEELMISSEKQKDKESLPVTKTFKSYKDLKMKERPGLNAAMPLQMKANLPNVSGNITGEKQLLKENANRYTWVDRLTTLQLLKKVDRKTIDKQYALSFADFKKMQEIKK